MFTANVSMMSLLPTQAASSTRLEEMSSSFNFNLDITARSFLNSNEGSIRCDSVYSSPTRENSRNVCRFQVEDFDREFKINKLELDEFTEIQYGNDEYKDAVVRHDSRMKRRSISDLVERYKELMKNSESIVIENKCAEQKIDEQ